MPADVRLELKWQDAPVDRRTVQSTAGTPGVTRAVQEDAGSVGEAGGRDPFRVALEHAGLPSALGAELPLLARKRLGSRGDALGIRLVGEVRSVRTTAFHPFGRRLGEDSLASGAVDALPTARQKSHVDEPAPILSGVLEVHPFMSVARCVGHNGHPVTVASSP